MTFGHLYSQDHNNEPPTKLQIALKKLAISYVLEIPRLLLASVLACVMVAAIIKLFAALLAAFLGSGGGTSSFWSMAIQFVLLGHTFAGPALLVIYMPIALALKKSSKRDWLLPFFGIIIATLNGAIVSMAMPPISLIVIPCSVIAGLFTGAFHDLFIELSNKFYFRKWLNP